MASKKLTFPELLDLIDLEDYRGIIDKDAFLRVTMEKGIPKMVSDIRGALRLAVDRIDDGFAVTQYDTELANESIGEIYSTSSVNIDIAA